jgi:hypothetical protein
LESQQGARWCRSEGPISGTVEGYLKVPVSRNGYDWTFLSAALAPDTVAEVA